MIFIYNFVAYPAAILKVPAMKQKMWKEWSPEDGRQVVRKRVVRSVENISPFDFYPAPYAQDVQSAEYVIERRKVTRTELATCYALPGYSKDGLDDVFELYPNGYLEPYEESENRPDSDLEGIPSDEDGDHSKAQGAFDCLGFYGSIQGNILAAFGVSVEDENRNYEAEIWIIDDIVIKATLNPDPLGLRPFYAASFEPIPGSFWGECITTRLADTQRILTATAVAHVVNLSYASGVQGDVSVPVGDAGALRLRVLSDDGSTCRFFFSFVVDIRRLYRCCADLTLVEDGCFRDGDTVEAAVVEHAAVSERGEWGLFVVLEVAVDEDAAVSELDEVGEGGVLEDGAVGEASSRAVATTLFDLSVCAYIPLGELIEYFILGF